MKTDPLNEKELWESEWCHEFEKLMRHRLVQGAFRYGANKAPGKVIKQWMIGAKQRIEEYEKTGNTEFLIDIANFCMKEYEMGIHPTKHFSNSAKVEKLKEK